ncbi:class I lanthipeptide [Flavobacterium sp. CAU 1735]|uniref:class I lanthipeptide n=1 Tax=Flavobacterium sp. CAU 1735 TaxID=3140361 RepID=UPI003261411E
MKKKTISKLAFNTMTLVELNEPKMASIIGGTVTIAGGTSLVMITMYTAINKVVR